MALVYDIKEVSLSAGAYSSTGPRSIVNSQIVTFKILVSDDEKILNPYDIQEQEVQEAVSGQDALNIRNFGPVKRIPILNEDVFEVYEEANTIFRIQPFMYCTAKRCQRDQQQRLLFHLSCEFSTGNRQSVTEQELHLIDPTDNYLELPFLKENIYGMNEYVLWEDLSSAGNPTPLRLPTGNQFAEPFMSKRAKRTIRQTQFEPIATEDELHQKIEERLYSVPIDQWPDNAQGRPPGQPPRWMIVAIDYQKTRIPSFLDTFLEGYMMTYTLDYRPPEPPNNPRDGGFWDRRALIDNYFNTVAGDPSSRTAWFDDNGGNAIVRGPLNEDGTKRPFDQPYVYRDFQVQPEISWFIDTTLGTGFLRTATPQP